jgi:succinoglycan biosynthesis protein ExoV
MAALQQIEASRRERLSTRRGPWSLLYYKDAFGNFGDDLNPWLWSRLLPGQFSAQATQRFVGIGTILNDLLPAGPKLIVGSGVGYGTPPTLSHECDVLFVRGPNTAKALGLPESLAITDPAYLIRKFYQPATVRKGVVYIPHHVSAFNADWKRIAERAGMTYVDPSGPVLTVVEAIRNAERVVTCAMHGAILADAFRTPWIRVKPYAHLNDFKWTDWGASMCVDVKTHELPSLYDKSSARATKRIMLTLRAWRRAGRPHRGACSNLPTIDQVSDPREFDAAVSALAALNNPNSAMLSSDQVLCDRIEQLSEAVASVKSA